MIHTDMSNADYHANPAIGSSGIKLLLRSPLHYWSRYLDPEREANEPSPAMKFGTAWHAAFFEPAEFAKNYVEVPEGIDKRSKAGKELFAHIEESGQIPMTAEDMAALRKMTERSNAHPITKLLKSLPHVCEHSFFDTDPHTGMAIKCRPDMLVYPCKELPNGAIIDGKTTTDASSGEDGFARSVLDFDMPTQAAFYCDIIQREFKTQGSPLFLWAAQEKDAPFCMQYFRATDMMMDYGRRKYKEGLNIAAAAYRADKWPGYGETINDIALPIWAMKIMNPTY